MDKASWDSVKKLVVVRNDESIAANHKIQTVQALLFSVASAIPEPTHELVKAGYPIAAERAVTAQWIADTQATMKRIEESDGGINDVFQTVANINEVLEYERASFRDLMNEGAAIQTKAKKNRIIQRLEEKGIYKSNDKALADRKLFDKTFERFLTECEELVRTGGLKKGTLTQRKALFTSLSKFSQATQYSLSLDGFDIKFYAAYQQWVLDIEGNYDNHFGGLIKRLVTFLGWCIDNGITVNPIFRSRKFKVTKEVFDVVFLNQEELEWLDDFRHHKNCKPSWIRIIDMALVQASLGCRYSDMVDSSWYFDGKFIKGYTHKNTSSYKIPLATSKWFDILRKPEYPNRSFALPVRHSEAVKVLSEQKFNKYIKECLKAMYETHGLHIHEHEMLAKLKTKRGVGKPEYDYKYNMISSHSLRRSFVSNMVRLGYKQETVGTMIGTKDLRELAKYFKADEEMILQETDRLLKAN